MTPVFTDTVVNPQYDPFLITMGAFAETNGFSPLVFGSCVLDESVTCTGIVISSFAKAMFPAEHRFYGVLL